MLSILLWTLAYGIVVAASIIFLGKPSSILGDLSPKVFLNLLLDWRFLLGGMLAVCARFIFIIINNIASKQPNLADAHLSITAIATSVAIVFVIVANQWFLGEQLRLFQLLGVGVIVLGIILVFR